MVVEAKSRALHYPTWSCCYILSVVLLLFVFEFSINIWLTNWNETVQLSDVNAESKEDPKCQQHKFRYLSLLLHDLNETFDANHTRYRKQWTTHNISSLSFPTKREYFLRLKYVNNKLYWRRYDEDKVPLHRYRAWFLYYFWSFIQWAQANELLLAPFDIVVYVFDGDRALFTNWKEEFPFFVSEGRAGAAAAAGSQQFVLFHSISRSLAGQFCHEDKWFSFLQQEQRQLKWADKQNKAVFRGQPFRNLMRDKLAAVANDKHKYPNLSSYLDIKLVKRPNLLRGMASDNPCFDGAESDCFTPSSFDRMSIAEEMNYRYHVVIDGQSVRDAFSRQIFYESVMLKQESEFQEFWYYDLVDGEHVIFWKNETDFIEIINDIFSMNPLQQDKMLQIALNGQQYAKSHLDVQSLHCFTMQMLQIYNHYFYDETSIYVECKDVEITQESLSGILSCHEHLGCFHYSGMDLNHLISKMRGNMRYVLCKLSNWLTAANNKKSKCGQP